MEGRERIKELLKQGKVNSSQATILLNALNESATRREKIFKQVLTQKEMRQRHIGGMLTVGIIAIFCLAIMLFLVGNQQRLGRDTLKAMAYFSQSAEPLAQGHYLEAVEIIKKGIKKAPNVPVGYTLLGSSYRLLNKDLSDTALAQAEKQAFEKAGQLKSLYERRQSMNGTALFFAGIFFLFIISGLGVLLVVLHNTLVSGEERVNEGWANLRSYYDKKLSLIPAVVEAVEEYAGHEQRTLEGVIAARRSAVEKTEGMDVNGLDQEHVKQAGQAMDLVAAGLGKIFALAENYPELKANVNYLTLQEQLQQTEDEILKARKTYNKRVKQYNAALKYFPLNAVAGMFAFEPKAYFEEQS